MFDSVAVMLEQYFPNDPPPKNPLIEKWLQMYPPTPRSEYSQVCDGYSCIWCSRCPKGSLWECPEEDIEEYRQYVLACQDWTERHTDFVNHITISLRLT